MSDTHHDGKQTPAEGRKAEDYQTDDRKMMERRNALKRLVLTTAYAVPIATVLLTRANDAMATSCRGGRCDD